MAIGLGIGLGGFPFDSIDGFWRWVDQCEHSRLDSIWQSDRLLSHHLTTESMSTMAALAGATRRIKFGMNSTVLGFRHPLLLAKQCATIDFLSNGRLLPSFGIGAATAPEWQAGGMRIDKRGARANECLQILQRLWTEDSVDFTGEFYQLSAATIAPKPVQRQLPLWIGGVSDAAIARTARYGTGWLGGLHGPEQAATTIAAIKRELAVQQRQIADDHYGATIAFRFGDDDAAGHPLMQAPQAESIRATGKPEAILALLQAFVQAGVSKFVAIPIAHGDSDMRTQTEQLITEILPALDTLAAA